MLDVKNVLEPLIMPFRIRGMNDAYFASGLRVKPISAARGAGSWLYRDLRVGGRGTYAWCHFSSQDYCHKNLSKVLRGHLSCANMNDRGPQAVNLRAPFCA